MGLIRYLLNNPQLLIVLFFVVGPVVRGIYEHLKRQAEARQAEIARERARIEALRTGGRTDTDAVSAGVALEQRAAQRRGLSPVPAPQPVPGRDASDTPTRPSRRASAQQAGQPAKKRRQAEATERRAPRPDPAVSPRQPVAARPQATRSPEAIEAAAAERMLAEAREQRGSSPSSLQRQAANSEEAARAAAGVALAASARSNAAWRRAIVMQELLMPPVSMR